MNLNQLRVFHAVAQSGSVSGGARALRVSQPAVSKQLGELEQALGTRLFDRQPRGMELTSAGELLAVHAERIFATERVAERELAELMGLTRGSLVVGASTTIGNYLVPKQFGRLKRQHPLLELQLEIGNAKSVEEAVLSQRVEVGLTEGFVESDGLDAAVFAHDELIVVAAPTFVFGTSPPITPELFITYPFLTREEGSGTRAVIESAFRQRGLTLQPSMELGSHEAIKGAVASGLGLAIVSRLVVELELSVGRLREVPIEGMTIRRALHRVQRSGRELSPAARVLVELLERAPRRPAADYQI